MQPGYFGFLKIVVILTAGKCAFGCTRSGQLQDSLHRYPPAARETDVTYPRPAADVAKQKVSSSERQTEVRGLVLFCVSLRSSRLRLSLSPIYVDQGITRESED
jgi:hypothetical protein